MKGFSDSRFLYVLIIITLFTLELGHILVGFSKIIVGVLFVALMFFSLFLVGNNNNRILESKKKQSIDNKFRLNENNNDI